MMIDLPEEIVILIYKASNSEGISINSFVGVGVYLSSKEIVGLVKKYKKYKSTREPSNFYVTGMWGGYKLAKRISVRTGLDVNDVICASLARLVRVI